MTADVRAHEIFKPDMEFYNKGKIGNWRSYMSDEQSKRIDEMTTKHLKYKRAIQYYYLSSSEQ